MDKEFLKALKKYANFILEKGFGAINLFLECRKMTQLEYDLHYKKCKKVLEKLLF